MAWILVCAQLCDLPPGETLTIPLVSIRKLESANRIGQISAVLTALGIEHEAIGDRITIASYRVCIKVLARNWKSVVGETCGMLWCDEVSRWDSDDSSANPAAEVMGSLRPTLATIPWALECLVSSPWSDDDYHAKMFDDGDKSGQRTAFLPTWIANPTLSEDDTHREEPDHHIWLREYAAQPSQMVSAALDKEDARRSFGMMLAPGSNRQFCVIDASSLRGDCFAWMLGHESRAGIVIDTIGGWQDEELREVKLDDIVTVLVAQCRTAGIRVVYGDQREEAGLEALFAQQRMGFESIAWTSSSKHDAFLALRRLLRDCRMSLPEHAQLLAEMRGCKARLLPSGVTSYETNGLDYLSCLVTLMHAYSRDWPESLARLLAGRPLEPDLSADEIVRAQAAKRKDDTRRRIAERTGNVRRMGP